MNFFKRLGMLVFMVLMIVVGCMLIGISINVLTPDRLTGWIDVMMALVGYQIGLGVIGALFVLVGIVAPYRQAKSLKHTRVVAFQNPDGEVTVSLSAIEEYIRRIAKDVPGIREIKSRVSVNKKGINVVSAVSISSGSNIPEITENIQMAVRGKVQSMLGVEEKINITMHVNKIMKGGAQAPEDIGMPEEAGGPATVPYREIE